MDWAIPLGCSDKFFREILLPSLLGRYGIGISLSRTERGNERKFGLEELIRVPRSMTALPRKPKGVAEHLDPKPFAHGRHRNHVEPRSLPVAAGGFQVMLGALPEFPLFAPVHRRLGRAEAGGSPGLDFHENQGVAVSGNDVNLAGGRPNVAPFDPVAEFLQAANGGVLSPSAENLIGI